MMNNDRIPVASPEETRAFYEWRQPIHKALPDLARRVFDLGNKFYYRCGFHYELEQRLGQVIVMTTRFNTPVLVTHPMAHELNYEIFIESLVQGAWSAASAGDDRRGPGAPWGTTVE